jgi:hypothetical protein
MTTGSHFGDVDGGIKILPDIVQTISNRQRYW